ncbi:MAG: ATP-dependent DNA helicase RecG, partial [Cyanobacteria bacterium REEB65]|nr:ATP-dependent DNA helicase RecG [Cyanobacteria bacterium REEB65]
ESEEEATGLHVGRIVPIYPLTEGLGQRTLRRVMAAALEQALPTVRDRLPRELRERHQLIDRPAALRAIHFPDRQEAQQAARRRLVFEELFWIQLAMAFKKAARERSGDGLVLAARKGGLVERAIASLPFDLTRAQRRVFGEVCLDLERPEPMSRLVQGDVGSGKTVVALLALLLAVDNGYQGALMAPTEILAEQHFRTFQQLLAPLHIEVAQLIGKQSRTERQTYLRALRTGFCKIAVGTHALLQDDVAFERLGLVVVDEQHRFGVQQRAKLRGKGRNMEMLTMTATPIPRTLALALYGDLDVSLLDELPPGRRPVATRWLKGRQGRKQAWEEVRAEVAKGRQAYVVFPLVEESEKLDARAATEEFEALRTGALVGLRIGLLHGQLPSSDKEATIADFRRGELDVLVATTVVEVGVDVPNATVMVVENAERFGL